MAVVRVVMVVVVVGGDGGVIFVLPLGQYLINQNPQH